MERIAACLLTPVHSVAVCKLDVFGKRIPCKCGDHQVSDDITSVM